MRPGATLVREDGVHWTVPRPEPDMGVLNTLIERLQVSYKTLRSHVIARVELHPVAGDGTCPTLRSLSVPRGRRAILSGAGYSESLEGNKTHNLWLRGARSTGLEAFLARASKASGTFLTLCEVHDGVMSLPFARPDSFDLDERADAVTEDTKRVTAQTALDVLKTLGLATGDNRVGGVLAQLDIKVADSETLQLAMLANNAELQKRIDSTIAQRRESEENAGFLQRMYKALFNTPGSIEKLSWTLTGIDLLTRVRAEYLQVVRAAIGDFNVKRLKEDVKTRDEVLVRIKEGMKRTLDELGLELRQVSAFEFYCPDYDTVQDVARKHEHDRELDELDKKQEVLDREKINRAHQATLDDLKRGGEVDTAEVRVAGQTRAARLDEHGKLEDQARDLKSKASDFRRKQGELDAQSEVRISETKQIAGFEEAKRQIELAGLISKAELDAEDRRAQIADRTSAQNQTFQVEMAKQLQGNSEALSAFLLREAPDVARALLEGKRNEEINGRLADLADRAAEQGDAQMAALLQGLNSFTNAQRAQVIATPSGNMVWGVTHIPPAHALPGVGSHTPPSDPPKGGETKPPEAN